MKGGRKENNGKSDLWRLTKRTVVPEIFWDRKTGFVTVVNGDKKIISSKPILATYALQVGDELIKKLRL